MTQLDAAPAPENADCAGCCTTGTGTDRRAVLRGAAAVGVAGVAGLALAACSFGSSSTSTASGPTTLGPTSDVPVGGGKVYKDDKVVVTQPTSGQFKAFSAVCTHAGCLVDGVQGGTIQCPCHGSQFKIADGSVANGPATSPLPAKTVAVQNGKLVVTV
ncbi:MULTISPECIES: Rieske (2Fe-2S) protein [Streptacidiphilus]|uniref:Cytochrome bc1 complex Rieske iron-sulfur subunit n=1 Tax=Streptacidiphilus cavernicola TaxID=3342716 RepID=A0ABV6UZJ4_9ACTN|nr:Rieske (2Fe-2S) protein [Streptacidiphilus jeojiense]